MDFDCFFRRITLLFPKNHQRLIHRRLIGSIHLNRSKIINQSRLRIGQHMMMTLTTQNCRELNSMNRPARRGIACSCDDFLLSILGLNLLSSDYILACPVQLAVLGFCNHRQPDMQIILIFITGTFRIQRLKNINFHGQYSKFSERQNRKEREGQLPTNRSWYYSGI